MTRRRRPPLAIVLAVGLFGVGHSAWAWGNSAAERPVQRTEKEVDLEGAIELLGAEEGERGSNAREPEVKGAQARPADILADTLDLDRSSGFDLSGLSANPLVPAPLDICANPLAAHQWLGAEWNRRAASLELFEDRLSDLRVLRRELERERSGVVARGGVAFLVKKLSDEVLNLLGARVITTAAACTAVAAGRRPLVVLTSCRQGDPQGCIRSILGAWVGFLTEWVGCTLSETAKVLSRVRDAIDVAEFAASNVEYYNVVAEQLTRLDREFQRYREKVEALRGLRELVDQGVEGLASACAEREQPESQEEAANPCLKRCQDEQPESCGPQPPCLRDGGAGSTGSDMTDPCRNFEERSAHFVKCGAPFLACLDKCSIEFPLR